MSFIDLLRNTLPSKVKTDEEINTFHTIEHGMPIGTITVEDVVMENGHIDIDEKKLKNIQVWVYQDEGTKPHFHLISEEKNFFTAIRLDVPEYFLHGKYKDKLNSAERKALNVFLLKDYDDDLIKGTNWQFLRATWNSTSNEKYKCKVKIMPDYRDLPDK